MGAPQLISMTANERTLKLLYDQKLNANAPPVPANYDIQSSSTGALTENSVVIFGNAVYVGTVERMTGLISVTFSGELQNQFGEEAPQFSNQLAVNTTGSSDALAPSLIGAQLNTNTLDLFFGEVLNSASVPGNSSFVVQSDDTLFDVTVDVIYGIRVRLTLGVAAPADATVTLTYTQPGSNQLKDPAGNLVASIVLPTLVTNLTEPNPVPAAGHYINRSDLEIKWGRDNIESWADLNNDEDEADINDTIQVAIDWAEAEIDNYFNGSVYSVPLSPADATVKSWATKLAGAELYRSRGLRDEGDDKAAGKMSGAENQARKQMGRYKSMVSRGPWTRRWPHSTAPTVEGPSVAPLGVVDRHNY